MLALIQIRLIILSFTPTRPASNSNPHASIPHIRSVSQHADIALSHNSISDLIVSCTFHHGSLLRTSFATSTATPPAPS
ncbi:hypothetical protein DFJ58DRAFT_801288 [Suillus subalutaceus]|uniref:uncharacterized protein n=1 Tax=Suillus subalutaceus TaxID=48586 RepID=UPI001B86D645|nr:uncharacterized protein DFJ58DRAFT_801288 [Suillus subalutaceus]KAG1845328.1 hypothetical protein DFJ58DRAFT_801288 [Suillus subalutaceus]